MRGEGEKWQNERRRQSKGRGERQAGETRTVGQEGEELRNRRRRGKRRRGDLDGKWGSETRDGGWIASCNAK